MEISDSLKKVLIEENKLLIKEINESREKIKRLENEIEELNSKVLAIEEELYSN